MGANLLVEAKCVPGDNDKRWASMMENGSMPSGINCFLLGQRKSTPIVRSSPPAA